MGELPSRLVRRGFLAVVQQVSFKAVLCQLLRLGSGEPLLVRAEERPVRQDEGPVLLREVLAVKVRVLRNGALRRRGGSPGV